MKNEYGYDENTSLKALLVILAIIVIVSLLGLGVLLTSSMGVL
jgi:hypothetical protein